jgi:hypothetical protein
MKNPGYALLHLDLLAVARRVFKRRLRNCSLVSLESAILGFERVGDIPGSAIPGIYSAYLRGGPAQPLEAVFEHNALDLISLAALGAKLDRMYSNPAEVEHAADHLGLAQAAIKSGQAGTANSHLTRASAAKDSENSRDALEMLAREARKRGEHEQAKSFLIQAIERAPDDPRIHLILAKHFEHRENDFCAALEHAAFTVSAEGVDSQRKRVERLRQRIDRKTKNN